MQKIINSLEIFLESLNFSNVRTFVLLRFVLHNVKSRYQLRKQNFGIHSIGLMSIIVLPPSRKGYSACMRYCERSRLENEVWILSFAQI